MKSIPIFAAQCWQGFYMIKLYLLSLLTTTYNRAKYIAQCLDGILMQKTDFDHEILASDY